MNYDGWSSVLLAASRGMDRILEMLLRAGGAHDTTREQGQTALHLAALAGEVECVAMLLEAGGPAAVRRVDTDGNLPLHQAAYSGCAASTRAILAADCELADATNAAGDTPLHLAAAKGHAEATIELLGGTSKGVAARRQQAEMESQMELLALRNTHPGSAMSHRYPVPSTHLNFSILMGYCGCFQRPPAYPCRWRAARSPRRAGNMRADRTGNGVKSWRPGPRGCEAAATPRASTRLTSPGS